MSSRSSTLCPLGLVVLARAGPLLGDMRARATSLRAARASVGAVEVLLSVQLGERAHRGETRRGGTRGGARARSPSVGRVGCPSMFGRSAKAPWWSWMSRELAVADQPDGVQPAHHLGLIAPRTRPPRAPARSPRTRARWRKTSSQRWSGVARFGAVVPTAPGRDPLGPPPRWESLADHGPTLPHLLDDVARLLGEALLQEVGQRRLLVRVPLYQRWIWRDPGRGPVPEGLGPRGRMHIQTASSDGSPRRSSTPILMRGVGVDEPHAERLLSCKLLGHLGGEEAVEEQLPSPSLAGPRPPRTSTMTAASPAVMTGGHALVEERWRRSSVTQGLDAVHLEEAPGRRGCAPGSSARRGRRCPRTCCGTSTHLVALAGSPRSSWLT